MKNQQKESLGVSRFAALHFVCCGLPLLLLSGVSLARFWNHWPAIAGGVAIVGVIGFVWYFKRGCATCPEMRDAVAEIDRPFTNQNQP